MIDDCRAKARKILRARDDGALADTWRAVNGDREILVLPVGTLLRPVMLNHWYRHRGRLSVYLRQLGVPVPSIYGSSADENPFIARTGARPFRLVDCAYSQHPGTARLQSSGLPLTRLLTTCILVGMHVPAKKRNPDLTRENLLQAAFWEMYRNGFRAADLDAILKKARVTKGARYH